MPDFFRSPVTKRSVLLSGKKTSVSLEQQFWDHLKSIAAARKLSLNKLIAEIDSSRQRVNLSSALRLFVLANYRAEVAPSADVVALR